MVNVPGQVFFLGATMGAYIRCGGSSYDGFGIINTSETNNTFDTLVSQNKNTSYLQ